MSRRPHTTTLFAPLAALALMAQAGYASIVNPSFEDVYPSPNTPYSMLPVGWNTTMADWGDQDPWDTAWAAEWDPWIHSPVAPSAGQFMAISSSWDSGSLWQSVTLSAGDTILVDIAMATNAWHADGWVRMALGTWPNFWSPVAHAHTYIPWGSGFGAAPGSQPWIEWQTLSLTVPATGTYDLMLSSGFGGTGDGFTNTYFDNVRVIPTPGAAALLGLGSLLVARRWR